jgi:hypothetical protein
MESVGESTHAATFVGSKAKPFPAEEMPDKAAASLSKAAIHAFKPTPASPARAAHGIAGLTSTPAGWQGGSRLKKRRLTPLRKDSLTKSLPKPITGLARF